MRLVLLRHGQTTANRLRFLGGGHEGPGLDADGRIQAATAGAVLRRLRPVAAVVSSLRRARETAVAALPAGLPLRVDTRLREMDFGMLDGLTWAEIEAHHPEAAAQWQRLGYPVPPGGEGLGAMVRRVVAVGLEVARAHPGADEDVVLVTHGGPIRLLVGLARGLEPATWWRVRVPHGGIRVVRMSASVTRRLAAVAAPVASG